MNLELNAQEPKSDEGAEELGRVEIVESSALTMKAREIVTLSPQRSSSCSPSSGSSSFSNNSGNRDLPTATGKSDPSGSSARQASGAKTPKGVAVNLKAMPTL
jgi:hypothetical protein